MTHKTLSETELGAQGSGQAFQCARCGMCLTACPVFAETGNEANCARGRVQLLRGLIEGHLELTDNLRDRIYACLGCNACNANCPSGVDVEELIHEARAAMRRKGVELPSLQEILRGNLAGDGNPFGEPRAARGAWLPEALRRPHPAPVVFHAGCSISYANSRTGKMALRLLEKAQADFTLMGDEEECCGDPLIRLGELTLARELQERNKARFRRFGVKRIVTPCAGCVKSFRREYREFESMHLVEWLAELIRDGKLRPEKPFPKRVIYFDGCDIGRHIGCYEPPREILRAIPGLELLEFTKNRQFGQCCGGPMMSNDPDMAKRIAGRRVQEAVDRGAEIIAAACPTCFIALRDGGSLIGQRIDVQDVIGLLYKSLA